MKEKYLDHYRKRNMNFKNIVKKQKIGVLVNNFKVKLQRNNTKKKPIVNEEDFNFFKETKSEPFCSTEGI